MDGPQVNKRLSSDIFNSSSITVKRSKLDDGLHDDLKNTAKSVSLSHGEHDPQANHGVERIAFPGPLQRGTKTSPLPQSRHQLTSLVHDRKEMLARSGKRVIGDPVYFDDGIILHWILDRTSRHGDAQTDIPRTSTSKNECSTTKTDVCVYELTGKALGMKSTERRVSIVKTGKPESRVGLYPSQNGHGIESAIMVSDSEEETDVPSPGLGKKPASVSVPHDPRTQLNPSNCSIIAPFSHQLVPDGVPAPISPIRASVAACVDNQNSTSFAEGIAAFQKLLTTALNGNSSSATTSMSAESNSSYQTLHERTINNHISYDPHPQPKFSSADDSDNDIQFISWRPGRGSPSPCPSIIEEESASGAYHSAGALSSPPKGDIGALPDATSHSTVIQQRSPSSSFCGTSQSSTARTPHDAEPRKEKVIDSLHGNKPSYWSGEDSDTDTTFSSSDDADAVVHHRSSEKGKAKASNADLSHFTPSPDVFSPEAQSADIGSPDDSPFMDDRANPSERSRNLSPPAVRPGCIVGHSGSPAPSQTVDRLEKQAVLDPHSADQLSNPRHRRSQVSRDHSCGQQHPDNRRSSRRFAVTNNFTKISLPKQPYGRARRILVPASDSLPLATVTMRADIQFLHRTEHYRISLDSLPNSGIYRHVEDACIVGDIIVLAHDGGPCQISLIPVKQKIRRLVDLPHKPHIVQSRRPEVGKGGISSLTHGYEKSDCLNFFTGGHDGFVYLWTIKDGHLNDTTSKKLKVFHDSSVTALSYRHHDKVLVSCAGRKLWNTDLRRSWSSEPVRLSNEVNQLHVHPQEPNLTVMEIKHLDSQIQIFDRRKGGYDRTPCLAFGYRSSSTKFETSYSKGCTRYNFFLRGFRDGSVILWDYRKAKDVVIKQQYQQAEPVVHTAFSNSDLVAFGDGFVTFSQLDSS